MKSTWQIICHNKKVIVTTQYEMVNFLISLISKYFHSEILKILQSFALDSLCLENGAFR